MDVSSAIRGGRAGRLASRRDKTGVKLVFARLRATASLVLQNTSPDYDGQAMTTIAIDGIDTTRLRGQVDALHAVVSRRYRYGERRPRMGHRPPARARSSAVRIELARRGFRRRGFVLSFGGEHVPEPLQLLGRGTRVRLDVVVRARSRVSRNRGALRRTS